MDVFWNISRENQFLALKGQIWIPVLLQKLGLLISIFFFSLALSCYMYCKIGGGRWCEVQDRIHGHCAMDDWNSIFQPDCRTKSGSLFMRIVTLHTNAHC